MLTRQPWFGPKRAFGWGRTPLRWQGWAVTLLFTLLIIASAYAFAGQALGMVLPTALAALLILVCWLTGTPPGGSWRLRRPRR